MAHPPCSISYDPRDGVRRRVPTAAFAPAQAPPSPGERWPAPEFDQQISVIPDGAAKPRRSGTQATGLCIGPWVPVLRFAATGMTSIVVR